MNSFRKWFYRPRRDDTSLMAQFYYADEKLNLVAGELDSFDGRKDPERCTALVNQLRQAQDKVLNICIEMMDKLLAEERASRDFRVKFPDDVMQETLSGQLWFGAECLAAGSSILNREAESTMMRPLAKAVTKTIESVRNLLREQCLKPIPEYTEKIRESLKIFDKLFAHFELSYVSAMVPVKSVEEYEMQQNVVVLLSDTLQRSTKLGLVTQEQIDNYDPALMFTIPRLAIIAGLVIFPDGPLNLDRDSKNMSELFRPFKTLLHKIRELLWTMSPSELATLEKCLCSMEEPDINIQSLQTENPIPPDLDLGPVSCTSDFVHRFYTNYPSCRQLTPEMFSLCSANKKPDKNERKRERNASKSSRTRARQERQNERFLSRLTGVEERPRARRRSRRGNSQSQHHPPPSHYFQYPEHFHQEVFPPPPPPPPSTPTTTTQHSLVSQSLQEQGMSHYNSSSRAPHSRTSSSSPIPIFVSISDIRQGHVSSRHHRARQSYQSSRHRADRISTITCACGSTNNHVPVSANRICVNPPTDQNSHFSEQQQYAPSEGYCPYPNSSAACPVYKPPNHIETSEYYRPRSFSPQDGNSTYNEVSNSSIVKNVSGNSELSRHGVIQNCVTSTIHVEPSVLSPNVFYDQSNAEINLPQSSPHSQIEPMSSELSRLTIIDESLNQERGNCDVCNNLQSCYCDSNIFDTKVHQAEDYSPEQGKVNASCVDDKTCSCNSNVDDAQDKSIHVSSESSSTTSLVVAPTPEPRRSRTSLNPYGSKISCHEFSKGHDERNRKLSIEESLDSSLQANCKYEKTSSEMEHEGDSSGSTSPHHSGTEDDEEVALALQAAEVAVSWKARERFSDPGDLIQRLFVCISGVADQLQTNYASDLRKILRCVFLMNQTPEEEEVEIVEGKEHFPSAREPGNEDGTSTNGSEQLSVESAEDALDVIDIPEAGERLNSPDEASDLEEETSPNLSSSLSDDSVSRSTLHTSSVTVPPSVFNDHSLMQYSTMSPPPFLSERAYDSILEAPDITLDNDSPNNEVSYSSQAHNIVQSERDSSQTDNYVYNFNLETIRENSHSSTSGQEALMPVATFVPVNSSAGSPAGFVESFPSANQQFPPATVQDPQEGLSSRRYPIVQEPPSWIPDNVAPRCMACGALFTVVRRRHHCRNCGKVFCGHCSRHSVPLPHFGIWKNVRVCNACFLYYVTSSADGSSALS